MIKRNIHHSLFESEDLRMGKGIAPIFKDTFGGVSELKSQAIKSGGVAWLKRGERYVYYMITKPCYWQKPRYEDLWKSLEHLKYLCLEQNVTQLSMPAIGCGLDGLKWETVKIMIERTFEDLPITITIYFWG
eukprot:TRINITY_DN3647_c0_g1_i2.p1 TRINITY_DN3647_c0_g1~~TRINITY_DN3647_c0_g1_i2.p1  ORF type:complete len:132 (-),score=22.34 TRINITY_DN3647_c0_g1_i2:6-401(-)